MGAVRGDGLLREDGCGGDVLVPMSYVLVLSVFKVEVHPKTRHFCKNSDTQGFISNLANLSSSQVLKILGISECILDHSTKKNKLS